ncbi:MAG: M20/M25/M40 family metallo-hydrolase [Candidatus Eremiobacteraeota bacterium]|nr:M20/M25/M40 family metallo-hydrolase [Candidatus Eremiobacteraeota bacterium]
MNSRLFYSALAVSALLASPLLAAADAPPIAAPPLDSHISNLLTSVSPGDLRALDTKLVSFGTRSLFSDTTSTATRGVYAARSWIRSQFEAAARSAGGRMTVSYDTYVQPKTARIPREVQVSSVIAVLKGDDPDGRTYVMSSHYDSRNSDGNDPVLDSPGADDNGSGTIAVIEAAKAMAGTRFHGTIVFACFDGEEQGLFGSDHYAKVLKKAGVDVEGNLNNDIIGASVGRDGRSAPDIVRLFSESLPVNAKVRTVNLLGSENDSPSRELARFVKRTAEQYVPPMQAEQIYRADRFLRGGDQESFQAQGFPAVRFVEKYENFDHQHQNIRVENGLQYGDLLRYVDFDYVARVTKMNVAALAALALGPKAPTDAQMLTKTLGYDTTLRWKPVPHASAYEFVWRETTSPVWQFSQSVGNVTQATLPISKDDYIIGVRALDSEGHRSPVSYPFPVRE